jgi:HPt (histidine-containing phosphotransfer) domain-containing protein
VRYLRQVPQTLSGLKESLAQENWDYIKSEGHRGKGVSANLALVQFQQAFAELENVALSADKSMVEAAVLKIEELYGQILAEFSVPVDPETGSPSASEEMTVEQLIALLERLLETVHHNELSDDLLEELMLADAGDCRDQLRMIYNACSDFEFEKAGGLIASLLETLREE